MVGATHRDGMSELRFEAVTPSCQRPPKTPTGDRLARAHSGGQGLIRSEAAPGRARREPLSPGGRLVVLDRRQLHVVGGGPPHQQADPVGHSPLLAGEFLQGAKL